MASSSGSGAISSGSSSLILQNSGSELEDVKALLDQRKRKRMISNRESARRSRMRKQKHLNDLMAQLDQLKKENHHIVTNLNITTQHYAAIDADNSILKAQVGELSNRLQSLNEIIAFLNGSSNNNNNGNNGVFEDGDLIDRDFSTTSSQPVVDGSFFNVPLQMPFYMNQPLTASADMFQDY